MKMTIAIAAISVGLSGCDLVDQLAHQVVQSQPPMTLVISPGFKMLIDGQTTAVFGRDECPRSNGLSRMFFGTSADEGSRNCIAITPESTSVPVILGLPGGPKETWTVERSGTSTVLRRPDGSLLVQAG